MTFRHPLHETTPIRRHWARAMLLALTFTVALPWLLAWAWNQSLGPLLGARPLTFLSAAALLLLLCLLCSLLLPRRHRARWQHADFGERP